MHNLLYGGRMQKNKPSRPTLFGDEPLIPREVALRHEVMRYADTHGLRAAGRRYECSRKPARQWHRRWTAGNDTFAEGSTRPHHSPTKTTPARTAQVVIGARKKAPCYGARHLLTCSILSEGKGAGHRMLSDAQLIRPPP